jgi:hypothetical protein
MLPGLPPIGSYAVRNGSIVWDFLRIMKASFGAK